MELYDSSNLLKSRVYDGLYETETRDNDLIEYCYIEGGNGITAVMITKGINDTIYYLLRDQQGSITGLVDDQRNFVEEYSYDAWGRRRNPNNWAYDNTPVPQFMFRGYTMHEMLDEFALINMNGRCYDPVVGRFLSPDIIIQDGYNTQCYNKYSYCVNNPLKYTDPSGWTSIGWGQWNDRLAALNDALWRESNERYIGMKDLFHQMVMGQFMMYLESLKGGGGGARAGNSMNAAVGESAGGNPPAPPGTNTPQGSQKENETFSEIDGDPLKGAAAASPNTPTKSNRPTNNQNNSQTTIDTYDESNLISNIIEIPSGPLSLASLATIGVDGLGKFGCYISKGTTGFMLINTGNIMKISYKDGKFTWGERVRIGLNIVATGASRIKNPWVQGAAATFSGFDAIGAWNGYYRQIDQIQISLGTGKIFIPYSLSLGFIIAGHLPFVGNFKGGYYVNNPFGN